MNTPIVIINPIDRSWTRRKFVLHFGAYGRTTLVAYADHLGDALDHCIDWAVGNAPGLICDDEVNEAYREAVELGASEADAYDQAAADTYCGGNCGNHILASEWGITAEDPSRAEMMAIIGDRGVSVEI